MSWPSLNPGELRHQVTILAPQTVTDVSGTSVVMAPILSSWAKIEATSGTDLIKSGQTTAQLAITVSMTWQAGIRSEMQIQARNGTYVIRTVENVQELDVTLKMICVALKENQ